MQMKEITYKEALREAMVEEMRRDEDIIFLGEDIGVYGGGFGVSYGMIEEFGEERLQIRTVPFGFAWERLRDLQRLWFSYQPG